MYGKLNKYFLFLFLFIVTVFWISCTSSLHENRLGAMYSQRYKLIEDIKLSLSKDSTQTNLLFDLANTYLELGMDNDAVRTYEHILAINENNFIGRYPDFIDAYLECHQSHRALELAGIYRTAYPDDPLAYISILQCDSTINEATLPNHIVEKAQDLLAADASKYASWNLTMPLAEHFVLLGEKEHALILLQRSYDITRKYDRWYFEKALYSIATNDLSSAKAHLDLFMVDEIIPRSAEQLSSPNIPLGRPLMAFHPIQEEYAKVCIAYSFIMFIDGNNKSAKDFYIDAIINDPGIMEKTSPLLNIPTIKWNSYTNEVVMSLP